MSCDNPTLTIHNDDSPWRDMTGGVDEELAGWHIVAEDQLDGLIAPEPLAGDTWKGMPLLAIDPARRRAVVNAAVFGDLERPDATRLGAGQSAVIGILRNPEAFAGYGALVEFLLRAELVRTYWHLCANLCRIERTDGERVYRERWYATHEYYTNECRRDNYGFSIEIDKVSHEMCVVGEAARRAVLDIDAIHVMSEGHFGLLRLAIRMQDHDTTNADDAWVVVDRLRAHGARFVIAKSLPDWAKAPDGGALQLCQPIGADLDAGCAPAALAPTVERLGDGTLYVADWLGQQVLPNDVAATLLREARRWCSDAYDDLIPEFAEHVCAWLARQG